MTISQLNIELERSLKKFIKDRKHIITGNLYRSVKFACVDNGDLNVHFSSLFYIQYLEHREFINTYFKSQEFNDIVAKYSIGTLQDLIYSSDMIK
jgi:hypothetical protein